MQQTSSLISIPVSTLHPETSLDVSFYIQEKRSQQQNKAAFKLYRGPDYPFESSDLENLAERGITRLFVGSYEHDRYQKYLRDNLDAVLEDETLPVQRRFSTLNEVVRGVLKESFGRNKVGETIELSQDMGRHTVDLISREDVVIGELYSVLYHDYQTFTHSANVSYYSVLLAKNLGITDNKMLNEIASAALLHDLGKLEVPESILNKRGRLTDKEFDIIKKHPTTGFTKLNFREDLSFGQLMMVYQHHERMDGSGYPVGLPGRELHEWSKLCAVVDVFEALTSNRPYRAGMSPSEALGIMERQETTGFDRDAFKCWKETINGS